MTRFVMFVLGLWVLEALGQPNSVHLFAEGTKDVIYEFAVSARRAEQLPHWTPGARFPPLTIDSAVRTAEKWMKKRYPDIEHFELTEVTIKKMPYPLTDGDRWYYRIRFDPHLNGLYGGQFTAVVLFDNSIVEPRTRD